MHESDFRLYAVRFTADRNARVLAYVTGLFARCEVCQCKPILEDRTARVLN